MHPWNCCRTCLSNSNLHPIFLLPERSERYTQIVFTIAGVKIEMNDTMPQEMCLNCITFINESIKFRKKCEETQNILDKNKCNGIKIETANFFDANEDNTAIQIIYYSDDDFKDFDDNVTLDTLQYQAEIENKTVDIDNKTLVDSKVIENNTNNIKNLIEFEKNDIELDEPKKYKKRKVRVKTLGKKEKKVKGENVREEIECEYCHKILTSKLSLRNHYKIHTGFDVVCEHCGKKFITRRLLLMHCRAKHGYEKTDKCSYCDYKASNAEQVKIHERLHTGEKPFVCKTCGAGFHRKSSYLQHVAIHLPDKTVECDQCPARFKSVTLMRIHKNRHRPSPYTFKCGVCENSFARRRNVARHLQRVHGLPPDRHIHRIKIH